MNRFLIILAAFSLSSCALIDKAVSAPAPLAQTMIDERGLVLSLQVFDTALNAIDRLIEARVIVPGSPRAIQIADAIRSAKLAYQAASAAQRVGNSGSYLTAINQAQVAIANINLLIGN